MAIDHRDKECAYKASLSGLKTFLQHLWILCPWARYLTTSKMGMIILFHRIVLTIKLDDIVKHLES